MIEFLRTAGILVAAMALEVPAAAATPAVAAAEPERPLLFAAQSRLEVNANGAVVAVAPVARLPEAVNAALERNLRALRFAPATKDGRPVGGVTYARQEVCAIPEGGHYRMAVKFLGNGPGEAEGGASPVPRYPAEALRAGATAEVSLVYRVEPDGSIVIESSELARGRSRYTKDFIAASRAWLEGQRAQPESLDGQAVATRMNTTVVYTLAESPGRPSARDNAMQRQARLEDEKIAKSGACAAAAKASEDGPRQVALNSPFKLVPTP